MGLERPKKKKKIEDFVLFVRWGSEDMQHDNFVLMHHVSCV